MVSQLTRFMRKNNWILELLASRISETIGYKATDFPGANSESQCEFLRLSVKRI